MEVLLAIIGVVGGSVATFITGYIAHKRKIKADRVARKADEERKIAAEERKREAEEKNKITEEERKRIEKEERKRIEKEKKEKEFTDFFIENLSKLLDKFPESSNKIDIDYFYYNFLVYLGCYCRLEYRQFVDGYIKLNISDSAIHKTMAEIENLVRRDINIRVLGELIIMRKDHIFAGFYDCKNMYNLGQDSSDEKQKNRQKIYKTGHKKISEFFENDSDKKNLLRQKFKELLYSLNSI